MNTLPGVWPQPKLPHVPATVPYNLRTAAVTNEAIMSYH
jgi:hypothetical protein